MGEQFAGQKAKCPMCSEPVTVASPAAPKKPPAAKPKMPPRKSDAAADESFVEPPPVESADQPVVEPSIEPPIESIGELADEPIEESAEESADLGFPQFDPHAPPPSRTTAKPSYTPRPKADMKKLVGMIIFVAASLLIVTICAIALPFVLNSGSNKTAENKDTANKTPVVAPPTKPTHALLKIDWAVADREDGKVFIDDIKRTLPETGEVVYKLAPGEYSITLKRRGFEAIEFTRSFEKGETHDYKPPWKAEDTGPTSPDGTAEQNDFDRWLMRFDLVKDDAASAQRAVTEFNEWLETHSFQFPDLRPRLLILSAALLFEVEETDGAVKQCEAFDTWMKEHEIDGPGLVANLYFEAAIMLVGAGQYETAKEYCQAGLADDTQGEESRGTLERLYAFLDRNPGVAGTGTGFLVSAEGYLLTNHHVIEDSKKVMVRIQGVEDEVEAQVVAQDPDEDMAVLKLDLPEGVDLKPIQIAPADARRGQKVCVWGYPSLSTSTDTLVTTSGVVSATKTPEGMVATDCEINPGNSGGPLFEAHGAVVGMITQKTIATHRLSSYGLAIPAEKLRGYLEEHIPGYKDRIVATPAEELEWHEVDEQYSASVMLIQNIQ